MDGRSKYGKIKTILKPIVGKTIHMDKLRRRIMIDIGSSETVIVETLKLMIDLGLIKEISAFVFKIESAEADI